MTKKTDSVCEVGGGGLMQGMSSGVIEQRENAYAVARPNPKTSL